MGYNFTTIHTNKHGAVVEVDDAAKYGHFERADGSEGGGLWFVESPEAVAKGCSKGLELVDYDGLSELPTRVWHALRDAGYYVPLCMVD